MSVNRLLLFLTFFVYSYSSFSQEKLYFVKSSKQEKFKPVDLERIFIVKTKDTTLTRKISSYTDSSLFFLKYKRVPDTSKTDSLVIKSDSLEYLVDKPMISLKDSIEVKFSEIEYMKQFRIKNRAWAEPFAWVAAGSVLGVVMLPIAAIDDGKEGVNSWLRFEAFLIAIAAPPLYIVSRKRKFDFEKDWGLTLKTD